MSQVDKNTVCVPPPHPHTIHLWATHFNRYWHVLFLALAQWAAGRGYWKSRAAHTLDIYKTTNHWNHRNVLFHFYWQTSCHADHKAVTQPSSPHCIISSFPSLSVFLTLISLDLSFFFLIQFFFLLNAFLCLVIWLSYLYLFLFITSLSCMSHMSGWLTHRCLRSVQVLLELQCNVLSDVCSDGEEYE